jgi:hypothetical protein
VSGVGEQPEEWLVQESQVAGPCMTCGRDGLVVVRNGIRLCFTCAMEAGKATVVATGFVRAKGGDEEDR